MEPSPAVVATYVLSAVVPLIHLSHLGLLWKRSVERRILYAHFVVIVLFVAAYLALLLFADRTLPILHLAQLLILLLSLALQGETVARFVKPCLSIFHPSRESIFIWILYAFTSGTLALFIAGGVCLFFDGLGDLSYTLVLAGLYIFHCSGVLMICMLEVAGELLWHQIERGARRSIFCVILSLIVIPLPAVLSQIPDYTRFLMANLIVSAVLNLCWTCNFAINLYKDWKNHAASIGSL